MIQEDVHFLLDNAPPKEVEYILTCLDSNTAYSTQELRERLLSEWDFTAQKDIAYSTRRLFDLGLANKGITGKQGYILTELGGKVRDILYKDSELYAEVMHFLHYSGYDEAVPSSRKLFWSYKLLCEIAWNRKTLSSSKDLAENIQSEIREIFYQAYTQVNSTKNEGGIFNIGGVNNWKRWISQLTPPPFKDTDKTLRLRETQHFELPLLSLDYIYRFRKYRYGDPVILDETLLDEIAKVFFLNPATCRELLNLASRLTKVVRMADTFAGTSITLLEAYNTNRL